MEFKNLGKGIIAAVSAGLLGYFNQLAIPVLMLAAVMALDYVTGLVSAGIHGELSSRVGIMGIVKKLLYLVLVAVGGCVDWLVLSGLSAVGIEFHVSFAFGLIITIWLILNELISILENLGEIEGFPLPGFLTKLLAKLKGTVEETAGKSPGQEREE